MHVKVSWSLAGGGGLEFRNVGKGKSLVCPMALRGQVVRLGLRGSGLLGVKVSDEIAGGVSRFRGLGPLEGRSSWWAVREG